MKSTKGYIIAIIGTICCAFVAAASLVWTLIYGVPYLFWSMQYHGPYTFWRQDASQIEKIEICSYDYKTSTRTVLVELSEDEEKQILSEISSVEFCEKFHPDVTDFGEYMICITYLDGEIEVIGSWSSGYISPDGEETFTYLTMDDDIFYPLIEKYVGYPLLD